MSNPRTALIVLLVIQAIAVLIYPPAFFSSAPQAIVLPAALLFLLGLALLGMNTGFLSPASGRNSLGFVQGVNIVVRLMIFLPNLKNAAGEWNFIFLLLQLIGIGISWYAIIEMNKRRVHHLLLRTLPDMP